jgi:hypothetical protein
MTYHYSLPYRSIRDSREDAIRHLLDGDPLSISLEFQEDELHDLLAAHELIADIWSVDDVLRLRPDLTAKQAWEVLKAVSDSYDVGQGISRYTIRGFARDLYGEFGVC